MVSKLGSPVLKIGTTLAILSSDGHIPVLKDSLIMYVRGSMNSSIQDLATKGGSSSCPALELFNDNITFQTRLLVTSKVAILFTLLSTYNRGFTSLFIFLASRKPIDTKNLLKAFAICKLSVT